VISVTIFINETPIFTRSAVNVSLPGQEKDCEYKLDTGTTLIHDRKDGAVKLAIAMLKTIKEVT
jgi:hypothetical protein